MRFLTILLLPLLLLFLGTPSGESTPALPAAPLQAMVGEDYAYTLDFLVFKDLAEGRLRLLPEELPGRYRAELVARTLGVASWLSGERTQSYVSVMEDDGTGKLRSVSHLASIHKKKQGEWNDRQKRYRFDYQAGKVYQEKGSNGDFTPGSVFELPAGEPGADLIAADLLLIVIDGRARGIVTRDLATGAIDVHMADAVVLATGGYGNVYYLSTNAKGSNVTAAWRAHRKGAFFANPCYTQIHPTCIPRAGDYQSKLTLMSESLRNDGRIWVPKKAGDKRPPDQIPDAERDYYLERKYPTYGNLAPRDISSRAAKQATDAGLGVGPGGLGVYLDFSDSIKRLGAKAIGERYGNLFDMYNRITGEDPYTSPMRIYPAVHYTMGGLWVDYNLMSTIPGLFVLGVYAVVYGIIQTALTLGVCYWLFDLDRDEEIPLGAAPLDAEKKAARTRSGRPRLPARGSRGPGATSR